MDQVIGVQYLNLILLAFCLVIVALIVFILGKRLRSFLTPAVAATVSAIVALALPAHLGKRWFIC